MRDKIYAEYEDAMKHKTGVLPYGIKPYGHECANPVFIGDKKSSVCKPDEEGNIVAFRNSILKKILLARSLASLNSAMCETCK